MFPKTHALSSALAVFLVSLYLGCDAASIVSWTLLAAAASVLLDVDHIVICLATGRGRRSLRRIFANPKKLFSDIESFHAEIKFRGAGLMRLITHALIIVLAGGILVNQSSAFALPVTVSLATHLTLDILDSLMNPDHR